MDGPEGEEIFVGDIAGAAEGVYIQAEGEYTHHPVYDLQFKVTSYEISMPEDIGGIVAFLGSGAIKGIGNALAKRIVKKFGTDTLRIIDEEPERLAEVKGISRERRWKRLPSIITKIAPAEMWLCSFPSSEFPQIWP